MLRLLRSRRTTEDVVWVAHLDDGSTCPEIDARGMEHGWAEVPHERVVALELIAQRQTHRDLRIIPPDGATPVLFRRRYIRVSGGKEQRDGVTVIGWESTDRASYWVVDGGGDVRVIDDLAALA